MNERDTTLLNDYFNGLLTPDEVRAVQDRAANEPAFGKEFALRADMETFPQKEAEREAFTALVREIGTGYFKDGQAVPEMKVARSNVRRWMALAATLTLIGVAIWFFSQTDTVAPTYKEFARHAPLSLTVMGKTEQAKTDAETAFNRHDYSLALSALDQVLQAEPENVKASLYRGICLLELQKSSEARGVFEPMAAGTSALREEAQWYLGLTYLQENNTAACKTALSTIAPGQAHYKDAQEILKRLK